MTNLLISCRSLIAAIPFGLAHRVSRQFEQMIRQIGHFRLNTAKNGPPTEGPFFITGLSLIKARWKHRGKRYRDVSQQ